MLFFLLNVILTVVCISLGMFFLVLIIPVRFRFRADLEEGKKQFVAGVALYFGLLAMDVYTKLEKVCFYVVVLGIRIRVYRKAFGDFGKKPTEQRSEQEKKKEKKSRFRLDAVDWIRIGRKVFPRLFGPIRFRRFGADLRVGFANPVATGLFYSSYSIFKYSLHKLENVTVRADFERKGIYGKIDLDGLICLIQYIPTLIFTYKLYRQRLRTKKGGKNG